MSAARLSNIFTIDSTSMDRIVSSWQCAWGNPVNITQQVIDFHEKYVPEKIQVPGRDAAIGSDEIDFRVGFIKEELTELIDALKEGNNAEELDAYIDIIWVALGSALMRFGEGATNDAMREVFRSNMAKVRIPGDFKIRKPAGWVGPDIEGVLAKWFPNGYNGA